MRSALTRAAEVLVEWCDGHPTNYPPTVIHVTDGESTDGNPADIAEAIAQISTTDGACLLFNLHVSSQPGQEIRFPSTNGQLPDDYARLLYQMSSTLPGHVAQQAAARGYHVSDASRGFMFNADPKDIANFFDIGTRPHLTTER